MHDKLYRFGTLIALILTAILLVAVAPFQAPTVPTPDLTGLTVPQAAARLNDAGLRLGNQATVPWTDEAELPPDTIQSQSIAADEPIAPGTSVDVAVLRQSNVHLIYDDNELTLINQSGIPLDLKTITFRGLDGSTTFSGAEWGRFLPDAVLDSGDCAQVWSIRAGAAKQVEGCNSIYWLTTNNAAWHFWTQTAGSGPFELLQGDVSRITCQAAPPESQDAPTTCSFFVPTGVFADPTVDYVYLVYTPNQFTVFNPSANAWMPLNGTRIESATASLILGDPALFDSHTDVADLSRLAPGQCTVWARGADAEALEDCHMIARSTITPEAVFWNAPFSIRATTQPSRSLSCPAATPGETTICIMPR